MVLRNEDGECGENEGNSTQQENFRRGKEKIRYGAIEVFGRRLESPTIIYLLFSYTHNPSRGIQFEDEDLVKKYLQSARFDKKNKEKIPFRNGSSRTGGGPSRTRRETVTDVRLVRTGQ